MTASPTNVHEERLVSGAVPHGTRPEGERYLGLDVGAETLKVVEMRREGGRWMVGRRQMIPHNSEPGRVLVPLLREWGWDSARGAAVTGRFRRQFNLRQIPPKQAQIHGCRWLVGEQAVTVISIGSRGFSVLELRGRGLAILRENSRCSQGTGNFLRQLVERFSLTVEEASQLCLSVAEPAALSGRCPVILKTDMTHLANKGEDRTRILAGLFDAVCENVLALVRPGTSPGQVVLTGGVTRSPRVRQFISRFLEQHGMGVVEVGEADALCLEAVGAALAAADAPGALPGLDTLVRRPSEIKLERLPALAAALPRVRRLPAPPLAEVGSGSGRIVLGLDIGSTGSKAVALDPATRQTVWEAYRRTLGNPVGAAQALVREYLEGPAGRIHPVAFGVTGSGREIVGSLLLSCYGKDAVCVVNEIVAHATGALHFDPRVDTIFEIGGQDAKYIRLADGRIIDCAMNEACSAGTGSFIEEQGRKFPGMTDVRQLGATALQAPFGVSLGQHCSVFMAEIIDEAVSAGVEIPAVAAGLYDSIIQNYLHRVKGNRSVGKVVFCQGMPFASDALPAAVARQTGSEVVIPPNPGTVGALGIALLAAGELPLATLPPLALETFLGARVDQKDTFVCRATVGCGGAGNRCRIDRLRTSVNERSQCFTWGGGCSLHDKGTRQRKLPDRTPDPFREREELLQQIIQPCLVNRGRPRVALSDEFMLKGLFPFFATFFHHTGYDLEIVTDSHPAALKRGAQAANVPFCAPMQLFHGLVGAMAERRPAHVFVPLIRSVPREADQRNSVTCPIVQASPDLLRWDLGQGRDPHAKPPVDAFAAAGCRLLSPVFQLGPDNLESDGFLAGCRQLACELEVDEDTWRRAWEAGLAAQREFDAGCRALGQRAVAFCAEHGLPAVVVLGRTYTIYNKVLNSNVPALLREQGAVAIPVDCYSIAQDVPVFDSMYWGYGQQILRAAHQVRRTPGVYGIYCSNYSCGPDSFNLHFAAHIMQGKPFAVIETDGHAGDAGTKTRVESFLYCVDEDRKADGGGVAANDLRALEVESVGLSQLLKTNGDAVLLVPHMGFASATVAAVLRGTGFRAESLPAPDVASMRLGRRYTSGKECLPMSLTLGTLIQRLEQAADPAARFIYLMPGAQGPCRFGVYNLLNRIVLDRLGWRDRVCIWAPEDSGYFTDMPAGTGAVVFAGMVAADLLMQALLDVRPFERSPGTAEGVYERRQAELLERLETIARAGLPLGTTLWNLGTGRLWGLADFLEEAAREFSALARVEPRPVVLLVGENYVRSTQFSNDDVVRKLEARGLRVRLTPQSDWIEYCDHVARGEAEHLRLSQQVTTWSEQRILAVAHRRMARHLGWPEPISISRVLEAAAPYLRTEVDGEALLCLGHPLDHYRRGEIDAVVSVGPLECMPGKIVEAQYHHVTERERLPTLCLSFNGDPLPEDALDNFAFEVQARFRDRAGADPVAGHPGVPA